MLGAFLVDGLGTHDDCFTVVRERIGKLDGIDVVLTVGVHWAVVDFVAISLGYLTWAVGVDVR